MTSNTTMRALWQAHEQARAAEVAAYAYPDDDKATDERRQAAYEARAAVTDALVAQVPEGLEGVAYQVAVLRFLLEITDGLSDHVSLPPLLANLEAGLRAQGVEVPVVQPEAHLAAAE